jgi:DNA repair exonuclease SbcCD ATPase subunit
MLSGHDMLATIERMLDDTRRELTNVDTRLEHASGELARVRQAELGVLSVLARLRLREIERGELVETLDETGRRVAEILAQRVDAQAALGAQIGATQEALAKLEQERTAQHAAVDAAEAAVDAAEAAAQQQLAADAEYRAVLDKAQASDAVADLAEAKATEASADRAEKGKPYETDPLFTYLWTRGYGTSRYRAGPLTRLLDGWVARVGEFEPLRRNYFMLSELPARLDEHAKRMRALADTDVAGVRALEQKAAEGAGVPERERALDAAEEALAAFDQKIEEREAALNALVEKRGSFASGEDDLSRQCTQLLSDTLRRERMQTLRERANRTTDNPDDDKAVDELTVIRTETPRLEEEVARYRQLHETHRERTAKLEEIRKRFKEHRYDAVTSEFVNSALIATLLGQLLSGALGVPDIWDAITKQQRHRNLGSNPRFGSGGFPRGPSPWRMPGGGGFPKGGGFRTGGGFGRGRGGFRTGGGF